MKVLGVILVAAVAGLSSCSWGPTEPLDFGEAPSRPTPAPAPAEVVRSREVRIYYLTQRQEELRLVRDAHAVPNTPRIAAAALEELVHGAPHRPDHWTPFPAAAQILSVTISEGVATVDWSSQVLDANVGAEVEALGIQSVVWTLTEFRSITGVRFTVQGQDRGTTENGRMIEDWWGHVGLGGQPWRRDETLRVLTGASLRPSDQSGSVPAHTASIAVALRSAQPFT